MAQHRRAVEAHHPGGRRYEQRLSVRDESARAVRRFCTSDASHLAEVGAEIDDPTLAFRLPHELRIVEPRQGCTGFVHYGRGTQPLEKSERAWISRTLRKKK